MISPRVIVIDICVRRRDDETSETPLLRVYRVVVTITQFPPLRVDRIRLLLKLSYYQKALQMQNLEGKLPYLEPLVAAHISSLHLE